MSIIHLNSTSELDKHLSKSKDKISVIDFHATCRIIFQILISTQYPNVNFFKCDVDAAKDVAALYRVTAMPTFILLKGSTQVDKVQGANKAGLESAVRRHASGSASTSAFSGKGQTLAGASGPMDLSRQASATFDKAASQLTNLDPQVQVLFGLIGAYIMFWYLTS